MDVLYNDSFAAEQGQGAPDNLRLAQLVNRGLSAWVEWTLNGQSTTGACRTLLVGYLADMSGGARVSIDKMLG